MFRDFILLLSMMSRIPVIIPQETVAEERARSWRLLPAWGLLLGVLVAGIMGVIATLGHPLAAAAGVGAGVILTGGIQFKQVMNLSQGFSVRKDAVQMLVNMKPSRYGLTAIVTGIILIFLKFGLYLQLLQNGQVWWMLVAAFVFSRFAMTFAVGFFPPTLYAGQGKLIQQNFKKQYFVFSFCLTVALFCLFGKFEFAVGAALSFLTVYFFCKTWTRRLYGLNEDCYGAIAEWGEVFFLLFCLMYNHLLSFANIFY